MNTLFRQILKSFSKYVTFSGRAHRLEWLSFLGFTVIFGALIDLTSYYLFPSMNFDGKSASSMPGLMFNLLIMLPSASLSVRRLHDTGRSGWWSFVCLTIIGIPLLLYWQLSRGDLEGNKYGEPPR